jgi:fused-like protein
VRKFAAFAAGNAAYHSHALYPLLEPCVAALTLSTGDADPKTRANAIGALGNLVRNSAELAPALAYADVVHALLGAVAELKSARDADQGALVEGRIALFSLGNLAAHAVGRSALVGARAMRLVEPLTTHTDALLARHAARLCARLA